MKKFLSKILIFCIPIILYLVIIIISDPFNYFNLVKINNDKSKQQWIDRSAETVIIGNVLFKKHAFISNPCPNIIIGDSRAVCLNTTIIENLTGLSYFNFGIPGGNYKTIISLFWFVNSKVKLKRICIVIGFHNYIRYWDDDLFSEGNSIDNKIYPYFTSPLLVGQAMNNIRMFLKINLYQKFIDDENTTTYKPMKINLLKKNIETRSVWNQKINDQKTYFKRWYKHPDEYLDSITRITEFCKKNNIAITFILVPYHADFHKLVKDVNLEEELTRFKNDFYKIGEVFDFDYKNEITQNKLLYCDIFHANDSVYNIICQEVWGKSGKRIARHYLPEMLPDKLNY